LLLLRLLLLERDFFDELDRLDFLDDERRLGAE
jgi:hypothetical protein